ncbi:flagellar type III secretion system pore protein FliP [Albimonas sp. CAU 1670]|uniref:flagellar type III secretion system pore protein FliP n=1 Tax=Albimonas sp. CAU 1670 TaxID=3032599 RepID=UPI0023D97BDD|nr:flagellar type III secretion system pore protein FliP [Albimonas sp. CAU 1670]MDF2231220.1 flagellar type III secretion system pore protein FliP [Albimonas sp. CAU 1670]
MLLAPAAAVAQELTLDLGGQESLTLRAIQLFVIVTLLSLAPALAVTVTCFPFMVTVLSILRSAIGLQQSPPNMLIVSLALFLSWFVMAPVFDAAWAAGVRPLLDDEIGIEEAAPRVLAPFREFMAARVDPDALDALAAAVPAAPPVEPPLPEETAPEAGAGAGEAPVAATAETRLLIPAFLLSEVQRAFEIGFLVYLPFLLIDLVVASVLMSMGMMMVPPAVVSLPFKLAFFVAADGWSLLAGALVRGYAT